MDSVYFVIIGMFIVTFVPRFIPLAIFSKIKMNKNLEKIIKYIPIAVFSSILSKDIFFLDNKLAISPNNYKILPAIVVFIVSIKYKSIGLSILVGVISLIILKLVIPL